MNNQQRSTGIDDLIANTQKDKESTTTTTNMRFLGTPESVTVTSVGSTASTGGPPYYCGNANAICGFSSCG